MGPEILNYAADTWGRSRVSGWIAVAWEVMRTYWRRITIVAVGTPMLVAAVWALVWWIRYPSVPDPSKMDAVDALNFIATDDFNKMTESHRKEYAIASIERLREKPFKDIVSMAMGGKEGEKRLADRKAIGANIMKLEQDADKKEIGSAALRVFLDKFYDLPKTDRDTYLTLWAMQEKMGRNKPKDGDGDKKDGDPAKGKPGEPRMPSPAEVESAWGDFLQHQPPRTAAQMGQLMEDMRKKRQMLGIKQPW